MTAKFSYCTDGEFFHGEFDTRDEALAEALARRRAHETTIETGLNEYPDVRFLVESTFEDQVSHLLERIQEHASEEYGTGASEWLGDASTEDERALVELLSGAFAQWVEQRPHLHVHFYSVCNVKRHDVSNLQDQEA